MYLDLCLNIPFCPKIKLYIIRIELFTCSSYYCWVNYAQEMCRSCLLFCMLYIASTHI